jgi:hypothetical protein
MSVFTSPQHMFSSQQKRHPHFCPSIATSIIAYTGTWLIIGALMLAACTSNPSSIQPKAAATQSPSPSPTATSVPKGTVLYQADWSHGLAALQGTHGWKVVQGQLETNTAGAAVLAIPYIPTVVNYAIEIRMQIVRLLQANGGSFIIFATRQSARDGYQAAVLGLEAGSRPNGAHPQAQVSIDPNSSTEIGSAYPIDYEPGSQWHTFRVEVQGNEADFLVDGVQIGRASSDKTDLLSNGPLGLSSALLDLRVSSLRIIAI